MAVNRGQMDWAKAYSAREQAAFEAAGTTREQAIENVAKTVLCNIRVYMGANGVAASDEAGFVKMMRGLGGYSAMIRTAIGREPIERQENGIGMPTNPEWWVWRGLMNATEEIRQQVQGTLADEYAQLQKKRHLRQWAPGWAGQRAQ